MLIVVVSDEPESTSGSSDVLTRLTGRHDMMWAMVSDMPAVGPDDDRRVRRRHRSFRPRAAPTSARGSSPPTAAPSSNAATEL